MCVRKKNCFVLCLGIGGQMSAEEAVIFESNPCYETCLRMRELDEAAKIVDAKTPPFSHFIPRVIKALDRAPKTAAQCIGLLLCFVSLLPCNYLHDRIFLTSRQHADRYGFIEPLAVLLFLFLFFSSFLSFLDFFFVPETRQRK